MYKVNVCIKGTSPILQHRFAPEVLQSLGGSGAVKQTGVLDYSQEWLASMYVTRKGQLCQPASHIEGALVNAAVSFKMKGRSRKTWKDAIKAYCYVQPDEVLHLYQGRPIQAPGPELVQEPTDHLSVSIMRVRVNRAAVARARLMIAAGWELAFTIEVHDDQVGADVLQEILAEAGRAIGIGDYRPRHGRFTVEEFEVEQ